MHPRECESEVGVGTKNTLFSHKPYWRINSESSAFLGISTIGTHKMPESRWKRLGLAGIAILAAIQTAKNGLKPPKSSTWGYFVPTLTEVFELCYETPRACVRFPSNSCNQSTDCSRTSNPDKRIIVRGPEPERNKKPHSDNGLPGSWPKAYWDLGTSHISSRHPLA